ncbi:MAG: ribonuclease III [Pseudomonadota bacterium]
MISLETLLSYYFKDVELLNQALIHPECSNHYNNQRLEFLGDRVVNLCISNMLYAKFKDEREGVLSQWLGYLVSRPILAEIANQIQLEMHLIFAKEARMNEEGLRSALADGLEALIGAIYLDGGYQTANQVVQRLWKTKLDQNLDHAPPRDFKSRLQETVQAIGFNLPEYKIIERTGFDHAPQFLVEVRVENVGKAQGYGKSRRLAEMQAAELLLKKINAPKAVP